MSKNSDVASGRLGELHHSRLLRVVLLVGRGREGLRRRGDRLRRRLSGLSGRVSTQGGTLVSSGTLNGSFRRVSGTCTLFGGTSSGCHILLRRSNSSVMRSGGNNWWLGLLDYFRDSGVGGGAFDRGRRAANRGGSSGA